MKPTTLLLGAASVVGTALLVKRWHQSRAVTQASPMDLPIGGVEIPNVGIAEVDPEPMTQISGEGIGPDMLVPGRIR